LRIAAKQDAALIAQARLDRGADHADGGNRHDAKSKAGQKDPKAAQAAAEFAPGQTPRKGKAAHSAAAFAARSSPTILPSARRTTLSQRAASSGA